MQGRLSHSESSFVETVCFNYEIMSFLEEMRANMFLLLLAFIEHSFTWVLLGFGHYYYCHYY